MVRNHVPDNKIQHIPSVKTGGRRLLAIGLALIVAEILIEHTNN
jgi:hypothetical protein